MLLSLPAAGSTCTAAEPWLCSIALWYPLRPSITFLSPPARTLAEVKQGTMGEEDEEEEDGAFPWDLRLDTVGR